MGCWSALSLLLKSALAKNGKTSYFSTENQNSEIFALQKSLWRFLAKSPKFGRCVKIHKVGGKKPQPNTG